MYTACNPTLMSCQPMTAKSIQIKEKTLTMENITLVFQLILQLAIPELFTNGPFAYTGRA